MDDEKDYSLYVQCRNCETIFFKQHQQALKDPTMKFCGLCRYQCIRCKKDVTTKCKLCETCGDLECLKCIRKHWKSKDVCNICYDSD